MKPSERRDAFERARLYLVAPGEFPVDILDVVVQAGVDVVQLRMKDGDAAEVLEIGEQWMGVCEQHNVPFVINDRPDIALALAADGVHLGQDDLPPIVAREILGPHAVIGRSTHSAPDIERAQREHDDGLADYIAVGPIWPTPTGPGKPGTGLELVTHAAAAVTFPWFGIGAIDTSNVASVVAAGAHRIVVVRAITLADDPAAAVDALRAGLPDTR
jgi:thiamine-phosphate pyrophosphorylase